MTELKVGGSRIVTTSGARVGLDRGLMLLLGAYAASSLPALLDPGALERVAPLWHLGLSPSPYWNPAHGGLVYGWAPVVAVSACILFMGPGLFLAAAVGHAQSWSRWLLDGLVGSLIAVSGIAIIGDTLVSGGLRGRPFGWAIALAALVAGGCWIARVRSGKAGIPCRWRDATVRWHVTLSVAVLLMLGTALAPKLHWEALSGDGCQALEVARLLLVQPVPFWPPEAGVVASFPGFTSFLFAYPLSWFVRLFGPVDATARVAFFLFLPVVAAGITAVAEAGRAALGRTEIALIWLSLIVYTVAMAFSAAYDPYSADLALPGTQDTLFVACFLGFLASFLAGDRTRIVVFVALSSISLPSGFFLLAFWMIASWMCIGPRPWREIRATALTMAGCALLGAVSGDVLAWFGLPGPGREYALAGLLRYFAFLQVTDVYRLAYVAIPAGLAPVATLALFARQDSASRALTLTTVAYFLMFFVMAHVSLHHFVPAMILPIAVAARVWPAWESHRVRWQVGRAAAGVAALWLAWPASSYIHVWPRQLGATIENRVPGYGRLAPTHMRSAMALRHLFPPDWDPLVPSARYGGSEFVWNRYARHTPGGNPNYVLQRADDPSPDGMSLIATEYGASLFVRDRRIWELDSAFRHDAAGSPWLAVPRPTLFHSHAPAGPRELDVAAFLKSLGLDPDPVLERLGIQH